MTTAKRKTATKPAHVKPLTSARWSGVKLSKTTEKTLNSAYSKRKTAKRSTGTKKQITKFAVGSTYNAEYLGKVYVVSRTPKTVTIRFNRTNSQGKKERRCNVRTSLSGEEEMIYPEGSGFANCPAIFAKHDFVRADASPTTKVIAKLPNVRITEPTGTKKKNAVNMRGKEKQIERWLKGSDMWNMPHGIKAKLDSDGRPTLYRTPINGSMTTAEVIEVIRSSQKNPWISDVKSDVHGDIVDRDFAIKVLGKKS